MKLVHHSSATCCQGSFVYTLVMYRTVSILFCAFLSTPQTREEWFWLAGFYYLHFSDQSGWLKTDHVGTSPIKLLVPN